MGVEIRKVEQASNDAFQNDGPDAPGRHCADDLVCWYATLASSSSGRSIQVTAKEAFPGRARRRSAAPEGF
jgi:hypothetical protein